MASYPHGRLQVHSIHTASQGGWLLRAMEVCLPGNITVTSKASNQSLRRLAIYDMAAIISRQCVSGAGLSRARLLNLRYAALRYHSGQYCPPYLLAGMVKYGVNFATFQPLNAEAICCMTA